MAVNVLNWVQRYIKNGIKVFTSRNYQSEAAPRMKTSNISNEKQLVPY